MKKHHYFNHNINYLINYKNLKKYDPLRLHNQDLYLKLYLLKFFLIHLSLK